MRKLTITEIQEKLPLNTIRADAKIVGKYSVTALFSHQNSRDFPLASSDRILEALVDTGEFRVACTLDHNPRLRMTYLFHASQQERVIKPPIAIAN